MAPIALFAQMARSTDRTLLAAEPLDLDHKHEIIRRVRQERDRNGGAGTAPDP
jgi:hypothetical protein